MDDTNIFFRSIDFIAAATVFALVVIVFCIMCVIMPHHAYRIKKCRKCDTIIYYAATTARVVQELLERDNIQMLDAGIFDSLLYWGCPESRRGVTSSGKNGMIELWFKTEEDLVTFKLKYSDDLFAKTIRSEMEGASDNRVSA